MSDGSHHPRLPSSEAVKLEAVSRLLRQAIRLAEGTEAAAHGRHDEGPAPPPAPSGASAPPASAPETPPATRPTGGMGGGGPAQVGYLLNLLQGEQTRLEELKKEVARRDTELGLKLQFAKKKEEELESREGELKKLEAQLRIREQQLQRREERARDHGRVPGTEGG